MRKVAVLLAGLMTVALLAGCGASETSDSKSSGYGRGAEPATAPGAPPALREQGPASPKQQNSDSPDITAARKEVVTGSVDITTADPIGGAGKVVDRVRAVSGRVDSRSEQPGTDTTKPRAQLTVRVPADKTDDFVNGLNGLGQVTNVTTERDDVTMQWQDLDARIKALQASVDRLRALVAGAASTADLIAAENALSSRQGELDSLTARKRQLDDEIALSTLTIDLSTDEPAGSGSDSYWDRIVDGWHSLLRALKSTGAALPWLAFLVLLAAVVWAMVWAIARLTTRRNRKTKSAEAVEKPTPTESLGAEQKSTPAESAGAEQKPAPAESPGTEEKSPPAESAEPTEEPTPPKSSDSVEKSAHEEGATAEPVSEEEATAETATPEKDQPSPKPDKREEP
ncbi:Na+-transporting methylmalonyl-CoA/oxaloacetate decarboxylase gamma subunit/outer membrane murein-binding lipoprotein Lpp [Nocardia transvalensis]|uniref:Na+-transporting methylmalonyl-CoA/oxaloacetate decarboxylase gamma subunit/outer membrane murein-binding lipoprotein Lpp n=1 Tax=Nocardia transvalensis TaxID=37333 RepID=A0A7W9PFM3_9NOCA|nr:DUF4349 domain-containing protein [Nocardia transvalensis]MBB5914738.1 Na+-transporting methylmalonyl-CoA/oxaloacetate decarboxylase gamma subunit/outer membrane murein-binding lipoprotein Lpp [Nocardia transvalensis]